MDPVQRVSEWSDGEEFSATLRESVRLTSEESSEEVRELTFELDAKAPTVSIGQIVAVLAPGSSEFGNEAHVRLYTAAGVDGGSSAPSSEQNGSAAVEQGGGHQRVQLCVRRCSYVDEYSGERYPGVASNYLCDLRIGDQVKLRGPYPIPFEVPRDLDADLILIGSGTGIAPFRAFMKDLYHRVLDWRGRIWLFYGAKTGLEMLYMNDVHDDFAQYYDRETFQAFRALSPRPDWDSPIDWNATLEERGEELWELLVSPKTYVYVAGLSDMMEALDLVFARIAGSSEAWERRKAELRAGERWMELIY